MDHIALLKHSPEAIVAYRSGTQISAREFLADARALAAVLPPGDHVLNVCSDRYRFAVGLAACLLSERVSLLPSTHTPEVIRRLAQFAPDAICLSDGRVDIELPRFFFPAKLGAPGAQFDVPCIPSSQLAAIVFTSGSSGAPLPYRKSWGPVARCVGRAAPLLGLQPGRAYSLVGTVPAQHMYGFESTVLLALLTGNAFSAAHPFYPADIADALAQVPAPRVLVTTPVHLRTVLAVPVTFPPVELVVSATAPLSESVALEVEARLDTRLMEIYGSTETGQIAVRRTAHTLTWTLWPQVRLQAHDDKMFAQGGHVEQPTQLCDVIEIVDEEHFFLHGRTADLVNVAGKRSSIGYLNVQLSTIPGVLDGAFFFSEEASVDGGVPRLGALVVAPGLSNAQLLEHLRQRIDPAFLPRPLVFVDSLPRNTTGKLPQQALRNAAARHMRNAGSA